jgi:serine/threonine protein kinase
MLLIPNHVITIQAKLSAMLQIALGLQCLHSHAIVHRDLKPQNIFVSKQVMKIGDFGSAKELRRGADGLSQNAMVGATLGWAAPEQMSKMMAQGQPADIFSLGTQRFSP